MSKNIGVAIVCRYNSSRLRGKILKKIDRKSILDHIFDRLLKIFSRDKIVIATSVERTDDIIVQHCIDNGYNYYRGSLGNVAERILGLSEHHGWDYFIRVNGDNLFIDLEVFKEMLLITEQENYDFISNVKGRTYPKGMSIEIINTSFYRLSYNDFIKKDLRYQEHVTLCFYEDKVTGKFFFHYNRVEIEDELDFAIDTIQDFENAKAVMLQLKEKSYHYNSSDIIKLYGHITK